jgi:hypothetical protein
VTGRFVAVGANVTVPGDAQRVDATGKWVTPGLVFAGSDAGTGVYGLFQLNEGRKQGDINASFSPAEGIDAASLTIGQTRTVESPPPSPPRTGPSSRVRRPPSTSQATSSTTCW